MFQKHDVAAVAIFKETSLKYLEKQKVEGEGPHGFIFLEILRRLVVSDCLVSVLSNIFETSLHFYCLHFTQQ